MDAVTLWVSIGAIAISGVAMWVNWITWKRGR